MHTYIPRLCVPYMNIKYRVGTMKPPRPKKTGQKQIGWQKGAGKEKQVPSQITRDQTKKGTSVWRIYE